MLIVHVFIHVKPEFQDAFIQTTVENATHSLTEPGIARFDLIQQIDDPHKFVLVEVYRDEHAPAQHKETAHYIRWRDRVAEMMVEPRVSIKFVNVFP